MYYFVNNVDYIGNFVYKFTEGECYYYVLDDIHKVLADILVAAVDFSSVQFLQPQLTAIMTTLYACYIPSVVPSILLGKK